MWRLRDGVGAHPAQAGDDAAGGVVLVQRVRQLLPRAVQRLLQRVRLQHEGIPLLRPRRRRPVASTGWATSTKLSTMLQISSSRIADMAPILAMPLNDLCAA